MGFSIENWREDDDPILDLSDTVGKSVSDKLQEHRDVEAENIRDIRKQRDEKRKEESESELQAKSITNRVLQYVRPKTDEKHPDFLRAQSKAAKGEGDKLNKQAKDKRWNLKPVEKETARAITNTIFYEKVLKPLNNVFGLIQSNNEKGAVEALEALPLDDLKKALASEYKDRHSAKDSADYVLSNLQDMQREIELSKASIKPVGKAFKKFIETLLVDEIKTDSPIFERKSSSVLILFQSIPFDINPENKEILKKATDDKVSENTFIELLQGDDDGLKTIEALLYIGSEKAKNAVLTMTEKHLKESLENPEATGFDFHKLTWRRNVYKPGIEKLVKERVGKYLEEIYAIKNGYNVVDRWRTKYDIGIDLELFSLKKLEEASPGAVKLLHEEYGICEFNRYPTGMLLRQVKMHGQDVPYGVVVFPEEDPNDAFDQDKKVLEQLYEGTKEKHLTRIFEVQRRFELMRFLVSLKGYSHKISFLVIGAHGSEDGLTFGRKGYLDKDILEKSRSIDRIKNMFEPEPEIVLFSCHTGADDGFAEMLSKKLGARVQAPTISTSPTSLTVAYKEDKPIFDVTYHGASADEHAEYVRGIKPDSKQ